MRVDKYEFFCFNFAEENLCRLHQENYVSDFKLLYFIEVLKKGEKISNSLSVCLLLGQNHKYHFSLVLGMKMDTILLIYRCSF